MLSVYRSHGVVKKDSRGDNFNKTAENRNIYQLVDKGWLIVNRMKAWQGSVGISNHRGIVSGHYICFRPRHNEDPRFLNHLLRSSAYTLEYARLSRGVRPNQIEIDNDLLRALPIRLPSTDEQRRIADFLDTETARIEGIQQATTKQTALLSEHLREEIRIATTAGSGEVRETGIPWMPHVSKGWRLLKISHAFSSGSGTTPTSDRLEYFDGPHPWVNSADLNDGDISTSQKSVTSNALRDFSALKLHPPGSLVVALYGQGATKGKVGILRIPACLNQACCALIPNGCVDSEFAAYWFRAHKDGIVALAYGAGQPNLSQELIRQLRIPAPEMSEQYSIVHQLRTTEEEVKRELGLLQKREGLLTERRQTLITAAVTGQIDMSTAGGRGIED
ncbi:restriction endonuclease subunit S [Micromonospora zamorensis]|uniref:restriction endonuclease subunit S n=1 Tax=Micromonospora zamorensis TaxID=709883 RepID=UPI00371E27A0